MTKDASKENLQRWVDLLGDLPPMPAVATKILEVASSEYANVAEVNRLISHDQGLASKVLGTCNSAYYGLPRRVKTLSRAVALLGFKAVRNLVLVHSLPWKRAGAPSFVEQTIFTHAAATAVTARVIAGQTGTADPEEALLGGLMHDAGRLALNLLLPEEYQPVMLAIYNREGRSTDLERQVLGTDHTEFGAIVLERWNFPMDLIQVAATHHDAPEQLGTIPLVVSAADETARMMGQGVKELDEPVESVPPALAHLGYGLDELEGLEERVRQGLEQSGDIFHLGAAA